MQMFNKCCRKRLTGPLRVPFAHKCSKTVRGPFLSHARIVSVDCSKGFNLTPFVFGEIKISSWLRHIKGQVGFFGKVKEASKFVGKGSFP